VLPAFLSSDVCLVCWVKWRHVWRIVCRIDMKLVVFVYSVLLFSDFFLFLVYVCWLSEGEFASNNQQPANFAVELSEGNATGNRQDTCSATCLSFSKIQYAKRTVHHFQGTSFCIRKRGCLNFFWFVFRDAAVQFEPGSTDCWSF
jgi:hypothetical protein